MSQIHFHHVFHYITIVYISISYHTLPTHSVQNDGGIILKGGNNYGDDPYNGRVEICHNSQWGTICDDLYTTYYQGVSNDVNNMNNVCSVICNQLGYTTCDDTSGLIDNADKPYADAGSGTIWLDDTVCDGTESKIGDCSHNNWGDENCGHSEDITVQCSGYVGNGYISTECNSSPTANTPNPTPSPTPSPTPAPTTNPTITPTFYPTKTPTKPATNNPTITPTSYPTKIPTNYPTKTPTNNPTDIPSKIPTNYPTKTPTNYPTKTPTNNPSKSPSDLPTPAPTFAPTDNSIGNSVVVQQTDAPTQAPIAREGSQNEDPVTTNSDHGKLFNDAKKEDPGKRILDGLIYIVIGAVACVCILCFCLLIYRTVRRKKDKTTKGVTTVSSPVSSSNDHDISSIAMTTIVHGNGSREKNPAMKFQRVMTQSYTMPNLLNMSAPNMMNMHIASYSMNFKSNNFGTMQDDENGMVGPGSPIGSEYDEAIAPGTLKLKHGIASMSSGSADCTGTDGTDGTEEDVDDDVMDDLDINDETAGNITAGNLDSIVTAGNIVTNNDKTSASMKMNGSYINESYMNENGDMIIGTFDINKVAMDDEILDDENTTMGNDDDVTIGMDNDVGDVDK